MRLGSTEATAPWASWTGQGGAVSTDWGQQSPPLPPNEQIVWGRLEGPGAENRLDTRIAARRGTLTCSDVLGLHAWQHRWDPLSRARGRGWGSGPPHDGWYD